MDRSANGLPLTPRRAAVWALSYAWTTAPRLLLALGITALVGALVAPFSAVAIGSLVSALRTVEDGGQPSPGSPLPWLMAVVSALLVGAVAGALRAYFRQRLGDELNVAASSDILEHAGRLDLPYLARPEAQDLLARATASPARDFIGFVTACVQALTSSVEVVLLLAALVWIEPALTPLLAVAAIPFLIHRSRLARARFEIERTKTTKRRWVHYYFSRLTQPRMVGPAKLLGLAPLMKRRFEAAFHEINLSMARLYRGEVLGQLVAAVLYLGALVAVLALIVSRALAGETPVGSVVTYGLAAFRLRGALLTVFGALSAGLERSLFITNLGAFLAAQPSIVGPGPAATKLGEGGGTFELEHVTFRYPDSDRPALEDISIRIAPGETVALVGPTGSGKTTLAMLLARLYDPTEGRILLDGVDLRDYDLEALHHWIAFAFQQPVYYEASARENLAYGDWTRLLEDEEALRRAAASTGVDRLFESLPRGYETQLGRLFGNHDLSGGQWRRLAVARALARPAGVLILDEPTAHQDVHGEQEMLAILRRLARGKTTILISHDLVTVRLAERILVLEAGRLVESGTHAELLRRNGAYEEWHRLYRQARLAEREPSGV